MSPVVVIVAVVAVASVVAVAMAIVRRESLRLAADPFAPVFDAVEAYERVVDELPDIVASTLDAADVRRILEFEMDFFDQHGVAARASVSSDRLPGEEGGVHGALVVDEVALVDYVMERCAGMGIEYLPIQVHSVIEIQLRYLRAIGAIGPAVELGE